MTEEKISKFIVNEEIDRYFDVSSLVDSGQPEIVFIMGGVAVGKTTIRKQYFATGYVVVDAVEIFLSLCRGEYLDFPGPFEDMMEIVGRLVADRAIKEQRNIVTEIIGSEVEPTKELIEAMKFAGYSVVGQRIDCGIEECLRRNMNRDEDCVSAYYAEPYQREWLISAANAASNNWDQSKNRINRG